MIEAVGFAAFLLNVLGNLLLAWKSVWGWVIRLVSITTWGVYAYFIDSPSMSANAITFFCINLFGIWKWTRPKPVIPTKDDSRRGAQWALRWLTSYRVAHAVDYDAEEKMLSVENLIQRQEEEIFRLRKEINER